MCDKFYNPADFIIDMALEDERRRMYRNNMGLTEEELLNRGLAPIGQHASDVSLADVYEKSAMRAREVGKLAQIIDHNEYLSGKEGEMNGEIAIEVDSGYQKGHVHPGPSTQEIPHYSDEISRFAVSWPYQLAYLVQRAFKNQYRNPATSVVVICQAIFMSLFVGSLYHGTLDQGFSTAVSNRQGALFFCMTNLAFGQMQSLMQFTLERPIFLKEKASGMYRVSAYFLAKMCVDVPNLLMAPVIFCTIAYWFIGFQPVVTKYLLFVVIIIVFVGTMSSLFVSISCLAPTPQIAQIIASLVTVVFFLFGGFYVSADTIPPYYLPFK